MTVHAKHFGAIGIGGDEGKARPAREPTPEFRAWVAMRSRCYNSRHQSFHLYGALGVGVCSRWNSFEAFLSDMGPRPTSLHVLGLYDPYGDFTPDNTKWMFRSEMIRNRRG